MELKTKSWYVWLWEYTYAEDLPNNLCPFFWKLIVAMLLFIPNVIFRIPVTIFNLFATYPIKRGDDRTGNGIGTWLVLFAIVTIIALNYYLFLWLMGDDKALAWAMGAILMDTMILTVLIKIIWDQNYIGDILAYKASYNMLVIFTKSWYNKHCPRINWKENEHK